MRRHQVDAQWAIPIRNLATNPSFEATSGTVEVWRNFLADPRRSAMSNLGGGTATVTDVADPRFLGGLQRQVAFSTDAPNPPYSLFFAGLTVAAGESWLFAQRVATTGVWPFVEIGGSSPPAYMTTASSYVNHGDGTRTCYRIVTFSAAGVCDPILRWSTGAVKAGDVIVLGDRHAVKTSTFLPWFSGDHSSDPDLTPSWTGAANNSPSALSGRAVAATGQGGVLPVSSSAWARSGPMSLRCIPSVSSSDSGAWVAGDRTLLSLSGYGVTFTPGATYTVLATCHLETPLLPPLATTTRCIQVAYNTAAGWTGASAVYSPVSPNLPGEYEHRLTFTLPDSAVACAVRLRNGATLGGGDIWWDDLMITPGIYTGPYRDGDSPGWAWQGLAHQSPGVGYPRP